MCCCYIFYTATTKSLSVSTKLKLLSCMFFLYYLYTCLLCRREKNSGSRILYHRRAVCCFNTRGQVSESSSTQLFFSLAELSRARRARNGAPWVIKFGFMHPRNFKIVRPSLHVTECEISRLLSLESNAYTVCLLCCGQLTAIDKRYPLCSFTCLYRGLRCTTH